MLRQRSTIDAKGASIVATRIGVWFIESRSFQRSICLLVQNLHSSLGFLQFRLAKPRKCNSLFVDFEQRCQGQVATVEFSHNFFQTLQCGFKVFRFRHGLCFLKYPTMTALLTHYGTTRNPTGNRVTLPARSSGCPFKWANFNFQQAESFVPALQLAPWPTSPKKNLLPSELLHP